MRLDLRLRWGLNSPITRNTTIGIWLSTEFRKRRIRERCFCFPSLPLARPAALPPNPSKQAGQHMLKFSNSNLTRRIQEIQTGPSAYLLLKEFSSVKQTAIEIGSLSITALIRKRRPSVVTA